MMDNNYLEESSIIFDPHQYEDINQKDRKLLAEAYERAIQVLKKNVTPMGFSACSLEDNEVTGTDANYRSVWARDGAMTVIWSLPLAANNKDLLNCQRPNLTDITSPSISGGGKFQQMFELIPIFQTMEAWEELDPLIVPCGL